MNGIVVKGEKENAVLVWEQVDDVTFGANEVLVDVKASAVNRADLMQARGGYPPPAGASPILGLEMAGVIAELGSDVDGFAVGDRVCALLPGGGYAERCAVPAGMLIRLPDDWSFEMGAALPEVWLTAYLNMFIHGELKAGESVLLHAGASGVGTAGIQMGKAAGATVVVTAGADWKLDRCRELGADLAYNRKTQDWAEALLAETDGVDVIVDPVGAAYFDANLRVLRRFGRLIHIGLLSGASAQINLVHMLFKRLTLHGSTLRSRPVAEKIEITQSFLDRFWPQFVSGELKPIIDTTFPMNEAQAAHDYIAADKNVGKVVLVV